MSATSSQSSDEPRFLAALAGRNHGRPPIWMMRQAGRTLASYRALREGVPFVEFCKRPEYAGEATLLPVRELGVDAAILFADILLPIEAWGIGLHYEEGVGPVVTPPLTDRAVVEGLGEADVEGACGYIGDVIRHVRTELPADVPLIGFAPSPWTFAAYAVQGRARKGFPDLKRFLYDDPEGFELLMDRVTELLVDYCRLQIEAGVQAFQIFDTWAELLPPHAFRAVLKPRVTRMLEAVSAVPRIYFPKGTAAYLDDLGDLPVEAVGCDWSVELDDARRRVGPDVTLQGNLDPLTLLAEPARIETAVAGMLDRVADDPAYVANLGHGLVPATPEANVHAFVEAIHRWWERQGA